MAGSESETTQAIDFHTLGKPSTGTSKSSCCMQKLNWKQDADLRFGQTMGWAVGTEYGVNTEDISPTRDCNPSTMYMMGLIQ
jgi:hypothetical protein